MDGLDLERGTYRTPPRRLSAFARWLPSLRFYVSFLPIVARSANMAARGVYDDDRWVRSSDDTRRCLETAGVRISVTGLNHVRDLSGPCVFLGNHMSMLETLVLPCFVRRLRPMTYVVKESLIHYPVFRHVMTSRDPIVVTRTDPRRDFQTVMEKGTHLFAGGRSLIIFPQTTRTLRFDRHEFNSIGVKLARRAGVPVIPIALRTDAWAPAKRFVKEFGRLDPTKEVHFAFGEPMKVTGRGTETHERTLTFIEEHLEAWGLPPVREPASQ